MMAIINRFQTSLTLKEKRWLVIADDDTLLRWASEDGPMYTNIIGIMA